MGSEPSVGSSKTGIDNPQFNRQDPTDASNSPDVNGVDMSAVEVSRSLEFWILHYLDLFVTS